MIDINKRLNIAIHLLLMLLLIIISTSLSKYEFLIGWVTGKIYAVPISVFIMPFIFITWSSLTLFAITRRERNELNKKLIRYVNVPLVFAVTLVLLLYAFNLDIKMGDYGKFLLITLAVINAILTGTSLNDYKRPRNTFGMVLMFYSVTLIQYSVFYTLFYGLISVYTRYEHFFTTILISTIIHVCIEFVVLPVFQIVATKKGK